MNVHVGAGVPTRAEAEAALEVLRRWRTHAANDGAWPVGAVLSHTYQSDFVPDETYRASLPDLQNGPESLIRGARRTIGDVGIAGFRVPIRHQRPDDPPMTLEAHVTGTVELVAAAKGINMSRIIRGFYQYADDVFGPETLADILRTQLDAQASARGRLLMRLSYPVRQASLRSGLEGWQYYDVAYEAILANGRAATMVHLDYTYSSTCPCSTELAEHARQTRGQIATPHAQRSVVRLSVLPAGQQVPSPEVLVALARNAVPTETQVIVKREDEQAFAELNGAHPIFVEDAARLFAEALENAPEVGDFRVVASHQESLHNHDAVAVLTHGLAFDEGGRLDVRLFDTLRPR